MNSVPAQSVTVAPNPDAMLISVWLHGRSPNTVRAYSADARSFLAFVAKPIASTTLEDLQAWSSSLASLAPATRARRIACVKSLFRFAKDTGFHSFNTAAALRGVKAEAVGLERILLEEGVLRMIGAEPVARLKTLLRLLYVCGLRRSEVTQLRWRDMNGSEKRGGFVSVLGKGGKLRRVEITPSLWRDLAALSPDAAPTAPLIPGRDGQTIHEKAVYRAVKAAAVRVGIDPAASPHWIRHSHASHALARGADLASLRDGLGHASINTTSRYLHAKPGSGPGSFLRD